jgi:adenosylhomocysteine nucleosidase
LSAAGVVAALEAEARTLGKLARRADGIRVLKDGTLVAVSGMGGPAAARAARALIDAGAAALVSWGMAGGLDPALAAGTICLPLRVVAEGGAAFPTDTHWREALGAAVAARCTVASGALFTSSHSIDDVAGKAAAFVRTGAVAVDMESAAVAQVAAAHGIPFAVIRVIVDTAADELPQAALAAVHGGTIRVSRLLPAIVKRPGDVAALMRLASRYRAARRSLSDVARTAVLAPLAFGAAAGSRIA